MMKRSLLEFSLTSIRDDRQLEHWLREHLLHPALDHGAGVVGHVGEGGTQARVEDDDLVTRPQLREECGNLAAVGSCHQVTIIIGKILKILLHQPCEIYTGIVDSDDLFHIEQ